MFDVLVKQVGRIFSSKNNGGKQVPKLTDRLHALKLAISAVGIALLLGYGQFRQHFLCYGIKGVDTSHLTSFCMTNGTTTIIERFTNQSSEYQLPNVGLSFITNDQAYRRINHNYIHSLWALIILLAACSYLAQRKWASLFRSDTLQALLQLHGHEDSKLARAATQARPYELLSRMKRTDKIDQVAAQDASEIVAKNEVVTRIIEIVNNYNNIYDHNLDYYNNQLVYLLLTKETSECRYSRLQLRRKLIWYSINSTVLSLSQFLLPIAFIGLEYKYYGLEYAFLLKNYLLGILESREFVMTINSIDYLLSGTIFPTVTSCRYIQHGLTGEEESYNVQCTVAMNEICGKLFVVIWWVSLISIWFELWSISLLLIGSLNYKLTNCLFGLRYWPGALKEAKSIVEFSGKRTALLNRYQQVNGIRKQINFLHQNKFAKKTSSANGKVGSVRSNDFLSEKERKRMEAEGDVPSLVYASDTESESYRDGSCLFTVIKDIASGIVAFVRWLVCCTIRRPARKSDEKEQNETTCHINMLYLLYLMHLRLGSSRTKTEDVIRMTSVALDNYLRDLEAQCNKTDCPTQNPFVSAPKLADTITKDNSTTTIAASQSKKEPELDGKKDTTNSTAIDV